MHSNIRLATIHGIPVGLNGSWFLIFALVTWSLAEGYLPPAYPGLPGPAYWLLAAVTSLLFFTSVLLHELGHSLTALRHGIPVRGITLFIFGGVAQIGREPDRPGVEFSIAIAGPATSLAIAVMFGGLFLLDRSIPYLAAPSFWLMRINLMLATFNLIPGFPLDGGRILRAAIWKATGSHRRATRAAALAGQLVAFGFMGLGVFTMLGGAFFNGLWLVFIGWFLHSAAAASSAQVGVQTLLRGVTVGQVMSTDCELVPPDLTIGQLVEEHVLTGGRRCFFVGRPEGHLAGLLTLREVGRIPREQWSWLPTERAMIPAADLVTVPPETPPAGRPAEDGRRERGTDAGRRRCRSHPRSAVARAGAPLRPYAGGTRGIGGRSTCTGLEVNPCAVEIVSGSAKRFPSNKLCRHDTDPHNPLLGGGLAWGATISTAQPEV